MTEPVAMAPAGPGRQSIAMQVLRIAVLTADALVLAAVLTIRFALPMGSGQDGEASFWAGLLLVYALILVFGLALVLNVIYMVALAFMRGRYDNGYGRISRCLLVLIPAAAVMGITVK